MKMQGEDDPVTITDWSSIPQWVDLHQFSERQQVRQEIDRSPTMYNVSPIVANDVVESIHEDHLRDAKRDQLAAASATRLTENRGLVERMTSWLSRRSIPAPDPATVRQEPA